MVPLTVNQKVPKIFYIPLYFNIHLFLLLAFHVPSKMWAGLLLQKTLQKRILTFIHMGRRLPLQSVFVLVFNLFFSVYVGCNDEVCYVFQEQEEIDFSQEVDDSSSSEEEDLGAVEEERSVILHLLSQLKLGMDLTRVYQFHLIDSVSVTLY